MSRYLKLVIILYFCILIASVYISPERISRNGNSEIDSKYEASGTTFLEHSYWALKVEPIFCISVHDGMECALECRKRDFCLSFNFAVYSRSKNCELLRGDKYSFSNNFQPSPLHHHYSIMSPCEYNPCKGGAKCQPLYGVNGFLCERVSGRITRAAPWFKLNNDSVCFGAKNDSYGSFTVSRSGTILTFKLVYISGYVTCNTKNLPYGSHWACNMNTQLGTILTDAANKVKFPHDYKNRSFTLPGYHRNSSKLIFHSSPQIVDRGEEFRIWYHEDYKNGSENDNAGHTCTDVYALYN